MTTDARPFAFLTRTFNARLLIRAANILRERG